MDCIMVEQFTSKFSNGEPNVKELSLPISDNELNKAVHELGATDSDDLVAYDYEFESQEIRDIFEALGILGYTVNEIDTIYRQLTKLSDEQLTLFRTYVLANDDENDAGDVLDELSEGTCHLINFDDFITEIREKQTKEEETMFVRFYNWLPPEERKEMVECYYVQRGKIICADDGTIVLIFDEEEAEEEESK